MHIPYKTLTLILAGLVAEGLLIAAHGPKGGYRLAREPEDISLLDIVEAAEGPPRSTIAFYAMVPVTGNRPVPFTTPGPGPRPPSPEG